MTEFGPYEASNLQASQAIMASQSQQPPAQQQEQADPPAYRLIPGSSGVRKIFGAQKILAKVFNGAYTSWTFPICTRCRPPLSLEGYRKLVFKNSKN